MSEVVMEMCERRECGFEITFCEGSPPLRSLFLVFVSQWGILVSCFSPPTLCYLANICMCSCHRYERRG
jgi:hypothetical protein